MASFKIMPSIHSITQVEKDRCDNWMELYQENFQNDVRDNSKSKDHNINSYSYEDVRRWTQRTNIFDKRFVFFPYNIVNVHWSLMYADMPNKVIFLNDSLMWENKKYLKVLWRYLYDESFDKRKIRLDAKEWRFVYNKNIPKQENGFDCGVFVLAMIHCIYTTGGLNRFSFHQSQMPSMRLLYCHYCLQAKF